MLDRGKVVLLLLLLFLKLEEVAFLLGKEAGLRLRNNFVQSLRQLEEEAVEQLRQHFRLDSDPLAEHLLRWTGRLALPQEQLQAYLPLP